ncbi:MAG: IS200/IS605 family transposase [Chloroflexota bacterium]
MPFWKCYYHVIWATKNREATISTAMEVIIFDAIRAKSNELRCSVLGVNGIADHVHVAVSIRPSLSVGDWVGQIKGTSSHAVNVAFSGLESKFRWQEDYGMLSYGAKNLPFILKYIEHQKEHHRIGNLEVYLEQIEE